MFPLELLLLTAATVAARADKLILHQDSPRIQYQFSQGTPPDGHSTPPGPHNIFALFWGGNAISIYGNILGNEKDIGITLDNQTQILDFSRPPPSGGPIWSRTGLAEGDHQLLVSYYGKSPQSAPGPPGVPESTLNLSYILLEREAVGDSAPNFEPTRIGTTPTSIPPGACLLDDTSPLIATNGEWTKSDRSPLGSYWYNSTALSTSFVNSSLVFSFFGAAVWCYGTRYPGGGSVEVSIDGERVESFNAAGYEQQYPLWSRQNLDSCPHNLVITTTNCPISSCAPCTGHPCPPCFDPCLSIDFFRVTDEGGCPSDMSLPRIESLGPDKQKFEPNFQSSDILAGTVGGALLLLFTVVAFLAWRVLFVLPMRQPLYVDY